MNAFSTCEPTLVILLTVMLPPDQEESQNSKSDPSLYLFISFSQPANSSLNTPTPVRTLSCKSTKASNVMSSAINCSLDGLSTAIVLDFSFLSNFSYSSKFFRFLIYSFISLLFSLLTETFPLLASRLKQTKLLAIRSSQFLH